MHSRDVVHAVGCDSDLAYVVLPTHTVDARLFERDAMPYETYDELQEAMSSCSRRGGMSAVGIVLDVDDNHVFVDVASPYLCLVGERAFGDVECVGEWSRSEVLRAGRATASSVSALSDCRRFALSFLAHICDETGVFSDEFFDRVFCASGRYGYVAAFAQRLAYMGDVVFTEMHTSFCLERLLRLVHAGYAVAFSLEVGTTCPYLVGDSYVLDVRHCVVLLCCEGALVLVDNFGAHVLDRATVESFGNVSAESSGHEPWGDGFMMCGVRRNVLMSGNMAMRIDEVCDLALSLEEESAVAFDDLEVVRTNSDDMTRRDLTDFRSFSLDDSLLVYKLRAMCLSSLEILQSHDAYLHVRRAEGRLDANIVDFGDQPQPQKTMISSAFFDDSKSDELSWDFGL